MRRRPFATILTGYALGIAPVALAQMHHVDAPERVTRALGVYEWTGDLQKPTASRFIPVSLFINGHFEDAGLYLARPVPFALESGDLYTVEQAGVPEGLLDLQTAERVVSGNALADDNPAGTWYGFGKFTTQAAPKPTRALPASAHVGTIETTPDPTHSHVPQPTTPSDTNPDRPQMTRRSPAPSDTSSGQSSSPTASSTDNNGQASGSSHGSSGSSSDDMDRPTLARRDPAQDAARRRAPGGRNNTSSVAAVGPAPADDPDRPTLTHNTQAKDEVQALTGMPLDLHQAVAVSDPVLRDPHPFARAWENGAERTETLAALAALAKPQVGAYLAANHLTPSREEVAPVPAAKSQEGIAANTENGMGAPPTLERGKPREYGGSAPDAAAKTSANPAIPATHAPTRPHAVARPTRKPTAAVSLTLGHEEVGGFTLSYGGLPTFVYTASTPAARADADPSLPATATHPTVFVTVVAQRLPSGELQVALSQVTDSQHQDRSPRMRLIDAVDPDASHRASLLFELRGTSTRQFALYRFISAKAQNTFTTASIE